MHIMFALRRWDWGRKTFGLRLALKQNDLQRLRSRRPFVAQNTKNLISIVVPVWNEEAGIPQLHENLVHACELLQNHGELELVFVDDGSSDATQESLHQHFEGEWNYRVVAHHQNRGIGAAFRTGFQHAQGQIVCTIDADCSYRPQGLKLLVEALNEGNGADIAVASPYHPLWRLGLSKCCSWAYRRIAPVALYTYTSVFRAYRRPVIETVSFAGDGFVSAAEILVNAARQGYRIVEVPMTLQARKVGQSKMKVARTAHAHLQMMRSLIPGRSGSGFFPRDARRAGSVLDFEKGRLSKPNRPLNWQAPSEDASD
jgi:dolichol-phosphate mannosyltransferase